MWRFWIFFWKLPFWSNVSSICLVILGEHILFTRHKCQLLKKVERNDFCRLNFKDEKG
jgi:hypothetical protein